MRLVRCFLLGVFVVLIGFSFSAQAQTAQELGKKAEDLINEGKFEEAVPLLEQFIEKYKTNLQRDVVKYLLGVSYLATDKPEKAIPLLEEVKKSQTPVAKPVQNYAIYYLAQAYQGKAAKATDDAARDAAFGAAAKELTDLEGRVKDLKEEEPGADLKTDIVMSRAVLYVQLKKFAEAETDLEALKSMEGADQLLAQVEYLLGYVYTERAKSLKAQFTEEATAKAVEMIEKARSIYEKITKSDNKAVANEAAFQLANLLFEEKKYPESRDAFRKLKTKKEIIAAQEERVKQSERNLRRNPGNRVLQRRLQREKQKLTEVKANPDFAIHALIRIGDTYFQDKKFDEARVIYRHVFDFADEDKKKQVWVQIVISLAVQGKADLAQGEFEKFQAKYPGDAMVKDVPYLIGNSLLQEGRNEEAIKVLNEALEKYPDANMAKQAPKMIADAHMRGGSPEKAIDVYRDVTKKIEAGELKVPPAFGEDVKRQLAMAIFQAANAAKLQGEERKPKVDEAISILDDVFANGKSEEVKEVVGFTLGQILYQEKRYAEAAPKFEQFHKTYPNSKNAERAYYLHAASLVAAGAGDQALGILQGFADKYPESQFAPRALDQIWRIKEKLKDLEGAKAGQDEILKRYPNSQWAILIHYTRAIATAKEKPEAAAESYLGVVKAYDAVIKADPNQASNANITRYVASALERLGQDYLKKAKQTKDDDAAKSAELTKEAQTTFRRVIVKFGGTRYSASAIKNLSDLLLIEVQEGKMKKADAMRFFSELAGESTTNEGKLQVIMARGFFAYRLGDIVQALKDFEEAMQSNLPVTWRQLEAYANILMNTAKDDSSRWQEALKIGMRMRSEFPKSQRAQASACFIIGNCYINTGNAAKAGPFFDELEKKYPWSERIVEAMFQRGVAAKEAGKFEGPDGCFEIWKKVVQDRRPNAEMFKGRAMLKIADTILELGSKAGSALLDPKTKKPLAPKVIATSYYEKAGIFYEAFPEIAAEGLYKAAEIQKGSGDNAGARSNLEIIIQDYSSSTWAPKARELLNKIPAS